MKMPNLASLNHAGVGLVSRDSQLGAYFCCVWAVAAPIANALASVKSMKRFIVLSQRWQDSNLRAYRILKERSGYRRASRMGNDILLKERRDVPGSIELRPRFEEGDVARLPQGLTRTNSSTEDANASTDLPQDDA